MVQAINERNTLSIDLETTGLSPFDSRILLCQISTGDKTFVMLPSKVDISKLVPFLRDSRWLKIVQNAVFESSFIQHFFKTDINNVFDTFLAEKLINSDSHENSLEALAQKYANVTLDKTIRKDFFNAKPIEMFTDKQLQYAADDATVLFPIYEAQKRQLEALGLSKIAEIEFDLTTVVANMENEGVPIDKALWREKLEGYKKKHEESRLRMHELIFDGTGVPEQMGLFVRDGVDLDSAKKVKEAFKKLGIDIDNTDERTISLVDHPAAKELLNYRGLAKILSSYGENILDKIHPFTNRLHSDFNQIGTRTGRFASKNPNLQQMPSDFRECVALMPDYKIVSADFANIELRILAKYSQDKEFLKAFESGDDPHKSTAAGMFNISIDEVTKEQRFIAKTINFGLVYGMGVNKLRDMLNAEARKNDQKELSDSQVKVLYNRYKQTYGGAINWLKEAGDIGFSQGYSTTMLGRRRVLAKPHFTGNDDEYNRLVAGTKRQAANSPIQGTSADITKLAMVNLYHDLSKYNYRAKMIIQVHDEIVVLAHKNEAESVKEMIVESMMESASSILEEVPVKVDANVSDKWSK